jgi:tol-pal system protein YbgF
MRQHIRKKERTMMMNKRINITHVLLLTLGCVLVFGSTQAVFGQQPQTTEAFDEIQQDIIALRNEFKLWIQKTEQDQAVIHQHIGDKLKELLAQTNDQNTDYPERVKKAQQVQATVESYSSGVEALEQTLASIETQMNAGLDKIEMALAAIEVSGIRRQGTAIEPGGLPVPDAATELPEGSQPEEDVPVLQIPPGQLFRAAYGFYMEGDYDTAIAGFQKYLFDYPETQLAGAAQFWIAESLAKLEEYEIALQEYDRLLTQYPQNDKLPDGYYGKASVLLKLGRKEEARQLLQYVVDHFGGSIAARKAENRLQEMQ